MTRVTFLDNKLSIELPKGWNELTEPELDALLEVMGTCLSDTAQLGVFCRLTGLKILRENPDGFLCVLPVDDRQLKLSVTPSQMAAMIEPLDWVFVPGDVPVRPDTMRGAKAVDAHLHGVRFADWLALENSYQGYMASNAPEAAAAMAALLYPGIVWESPLTGPEVFAVVTWYTQVKGLFANLWPRFFKPAGGEGATDARAMRELMDNEIRALTGGDVTKEQVVFDTDCWRALTELDHKAREAEEFNAQMAKYKK